MIIWKLWHSENLFLSQKFCIKLKFPDSEAGYILHFPNLCRWLFFVHFCQSQHKDPQRTGLVVKEQIQDAGAVVLHFLALLQCSYVNLSKLVLLLLCLHLPFSCHVQLGCKFFGMWTDFFWSSENTFVCPYKHPARFHIRCGWLWQ